MFEKKVDNLCCQCKVRAALLYIGHLLLEISFGGMPAGAVSQKDMKVAALFIDSTDMQSKMV